MSTRELVESVTTSLPPATESVSGALHANRAAGAVAHAECFLTEHDVGRNLIRGRGFFPNHDAAVIEVGDKKHVLEDDRRLRSAELVRAVVLDGRTEISLAEHEIRGGVI